MCDKKGDYSLFVTYKSSSQAEPAHVDSLRLVSLDKQPSIGGAKLGDKLTITGKCLDQLQGVSLVPTLGGDAVPSKALDTKDSTQAIASFDKLADKTTYYLRYVMKVQSGKPIEAQSVTVTFQQPGGNGTPTTPNPAPPTKKKPVRRLRARILK